MTKVFISSVQKEFSEERKALVKYIREDALLRRFFEPFIFEEQPAFLHPNTNRSRTISYQSSGGRGPMRMAPKVAPNI